MGQCGQILHCFAQMEFLEMEHPCPHPLTLTSVLAESFRFLEITSVVFVWYPLHQDLLWSIGLMSINAMLSFRKIIPFFKQTIREIYIC